MLKSVSSVTNAIGALNYKGTWDASTNTPTIVSGVGAKGDYFVVSVAGSTTIDGISNWGIGDWIVYNGNIWQRVEGGADLNGVNLSLTGNAVIDGNIASGVASTSLAIEIFRTANANIRLDSQGTGATFQARSFLDQADQGPICNFVKARGTKNTPVIVQSGDLLAQYRGAGHDGTNVIHAANMEIRVDGTPGTNDMPGRITFNTTQDGNNSPSERMRIDNAGNVVVNTAALATTATNGFLYVPSCAGTPTGTPTTYTGRVPIVVDTTNNKLYFYSSGQWRDAGP